MNPSVSMQRSNSYQQIKPPQYGGPAPQQFGSLPPQYGSSGPQQYGTAPPQYGSGGPQPFAPAGGPPPFNAAGGPPPQQFGQPNPYNQFNMTGGPPPTYSVPYASGPPSYGNQTYSGNPPIQQFSTQQPNIPPGAQGYVGSVSLAKGGNMSLSKLNPNLAKIRIGLGWDVRQTGGPAFDLDASAFLLKADGRVRMSQDLVFYNNKTSVDGSVYHHGDNITGVGDGDDEIVSLDLTRVPMEIQKIVFVCSIYEAEVRQQNFGMVSRAFIRVVDDLSNQEMCRFDLTEEASLLSSMIFGEVYRYNNEWKFRAVGQGIQGGLKAIGAMFGLNLQ